MRYNLKNRPPNHDDYDKDWFEGFEKELREDAKNIGDWRVSQYIRKEILGE